MAGPATAHWETSHWSASTPSLLKHHGKTTIFIRFVVEVGVIGLCTALYGSLKRKQNIQACPERQFNLQENRRIMCNNIIIYVLFIIIWFKFCEIIMDFILN